MVGRTNWNILANYASPIVSFCSNYFFAPVYLRVLGSDAYGVISFYTLLFSIVSFVDAGVSASINREFARQLPSLYKRGLLVLFERIYGLICLSIVLLIFIGASPIGSLFLNTKAYSLDIQTTYIRLIGLGVGMQLLASIYYGGLMGLQRQVSASGVQSLWSLCRSGLVLAPLYYWRANIEVFLWWTVCCNAIYILTLRGLVFRALGGAKGVRALALRAVDPEIWRYMRGMLIIAPLSAISFQLDKLFVSHYFTLSEYGYYNLCSLIGQIPVIVSAPIGLAVFPALTQAYTSHQPVAVRGLVYKFSFITNALVAPLCLSLALYGGLLYQMWMGDSAGARHSAGTAAMGFIISGLSIGNSLRAAQIVPYYYLLAAGKTRITLWQTIGQMALVIPLLYIARMHYGLSGIGAPWALANGFSLCFILWVLYRELWQGNGGARYLRNCYMRPLAINLLVGLAGYAAAVSFARTNIAVLSVAVVSGLLMLLCNYVLWRQSGMATAKKEDVLNM